MIRKSSQTVPTKKIRLGVYMIRVVFSLYLTVTVSITLLQMTGEYLRELNHIKNDLIVTQAIFADSLINAAWTFDTAALTASLEGILKIPDIVGVKIDGLEKPADWKKPFPIRLGTIANTAPFVANLSLFDWHTKPSLQLIAHSFQLKKKGVVLGEVTLYSSHQLVIDAVKYDFLSILIAAIIKTAVLWLLFIWVFNRLVSRKLTMFCQTMDNADIDNPETMSLKLQTDDIEELCRIEQAYNNLFKRVFEKKNLLNELNASLEEKVILRTQDLEETNLQLIAAKKKRRVPIWQKVAL